MGAGVHISEHKEENEKKRRGVSVRRENFGVSSNH